MDNQTVKSQDAIGELAMAMAKAQLDIKVAVFDKKANYGPYASFRSVREASIEALSKNGLAIFQPVSFDGTNYFLETILAHSSGQSIRTKIKLIIDRNNMQGLGSAITYAKRYAWGAIVCVVSDEDDDGQEASKTEVKEPVEQAHKPVVNHAPQAAKTPKVVTPMEQIAEIAKARGMTNTAISEAIKRTTNKAASKDCTYDELMAVIDYLKLMGKPKDKYVDHTV